MRVDVSVECLRVCSLQSSDLVARVDPNENSGAACEQAPSIRGYGELAHRLYSGENMMPTKVIFKTSIMELDFFRKHFWYNQEQLGSEISNVNCLKPLQN